MLSSYSQQILFSDLFEIDKTVIEEYGAFNASLLADLPLFIDPFLLFTSSKNEYRILHDKIIEYLDFLRHKSTSQIVSLDDLEAYYRFGEVKETWLGFSVIGNEGRGLGPKFAKTLNRNFKLLFSHATAGITQGNHLEKLCLIDEGIGRDNISDFTTNLIKEFLLEYTQAFARQKLAPEQYSRRSVKKVKFDYQKQAWLPMTFDLPVFGRDYIILVPRDLLSLDETWINRTDLLHDFDDLPASISDAALRGSINNYLMQTLPDISKRKNKQHTLKERMAAARSTIEQFPETIDYFIKFKEDNGYEAVAASDARVNYAVALFLGNFTRLAALLAEESDFYDFSGTTLDSAISKVERLKQVIEQKRGFQFFYDENNNPISREPDIRIVHRFTWLNRPVGGLLKGSSGLKSNVESPAELLKKLFPVEFKLASNPSLRKYFEQWKELKQKEDPKKPIVVIFHASELEKVKVGILLTELNIIGDREILFVSIQQRDQMSKEIDSSISTNIDISLNKPQDAEKPNHRAIFFTALPVEFKSVRSHLDDVHEVRGLQGSIYEQGVFRSLNSAWDVLLVETGAGNVDAAVETERAIAQFKPAVVFFVGIAGGIKDVQLGDIVAATKIYGYERGSAKNTFEPRPDVGESAYALVERAKAEARNDDWLNDLQQAGFTTNPKVLVGPIAAGEKVLKSTKSQVYKFLRSQYGDTLAVEMEGRGFLRAARANSANAIVIRGISDLIDDKEGADASGSQSIASNHASFFAFHMLSKLHPEVQAK